MVKRLNLLNGLAIFAVVLNHAAHQGFNAMFWWTDRYLPGASVPNYDQIGSLPYYFLAIIIKLSPFSIPAFVFISGFFVAYSSRGKHSRLSWKMVKTRIINLLIPYLIWSVAIFSLNWIQSCFDSCSLEPFSTYLLKLLFGRAVLAYWYILLICQLFLLSVIIVPFTKAQWKLSLIIAIFIHIFVLSLIYLRLFGIETPSFLKIVYKPGFVGREILYFIIGIIVGSHLSEFSNWVIRYKKILLIITIVLAIFSIIEGELIFKVAGDHSRESHLTLPMTFFVLSLIFCFLAYKDVPIPNSKMINSLGLRSYGIYLIHITIITMFARIVYHIAPKLLANAILFLPFLIIVGIGIPMTLMTWIGRSRLKTIYPYLFG